MDGWALVARPARGFFKDSSLFCPPKMSPIQLGHDLSCLCKRQLGFMNFGPREVLYVKNNKKCWIFRIQRSYYYLHMLFSSK